MIEDLIRQTALLERRLDRLTMPEIGGWRAIASTTLTGSAASVTFSNIPQIFRTLALVVQARTDRVLENDALIIRFNADSGANYDDNSVYLTNDTVSGITRRGQDGIRGIAEAANSRANTFSPTFIYVFNYADTNLEKWVDLYASAFGDVSADADLITYFTGARWRNTDAIATITLIPGVGPNFVTSSVFQVWGIL